MIGAYLNKTTKILSILDLEYYDNLQEHHQYSELDKNE